MRPRTAITTLLFLLLVVTGLVAFAATSDDQAELTSGQFDDSGRSSLANDLLTGLLPIVESATSEEQASPFQPPGKPPGRPPDPPGQNDPPNPPGRPPDRPPGHSQGE